MNSQLHHRKAREKAGRRAEIFAEIYLRLKGYHILERRFKTHQGEIDIIACKKDVLAIVEVKRRATLSEAQDSVTDYARRRISKTAETYYARTSHVQNKGLRFDVIYVTQFWKITHEIDAWRDY